jgi:XTP/dITP diphosphohydrolase
MKIGAPDRLSLSGRSLMPYPTFVNNIVKISELTIATNNAGKLAELRSLLDSEPIELRSLAHFPDAKEVEETGSTFVENARLKASEYARQTGSFTLADDSGLEIDALGGRPGVLSARYGGDHLGFAEKMQLILDELSLGGQPDRRARFVCAIAVAAPDGQIVFEAEGICEGRIAEAPAGSGGFGYDPIFIPDGFESSFGELSGAVKQQISHRARAFAEIMPFLRDFTAL